MRTPQRLASLRCPALRPPALRGLGVALALALSLAGAPRPAAALSATEVADASFDVLVLRPLNATALVLGGVFFVASVPFVAPVEGRKGIEGAWDVFVRAPYEYTVTRPLGEL